MLLAIDASTRRVGLALYDGTQVISEVTWQSQNHHTVELAPGLDLLMERSNVRSTDLRVIAVALGPGSFTSLRIGLGLAKGMSLALHIPLVGIPTLDITAASVPLQNASLAAVLQAGRGRLGVGWYTNVDGTGWVSQEEPQVMHIEDLAAKIRKPTIICGELSGDERQLLARKRKNAILCTPAASLRRPAYLAELGWVRWQAGQVDDAVSLSPYYLHIAEAIPG